MKRGFTILELLVASLLLGMLMTVLTMIFNQSSISWRVGAASIADLDKTTEAIAAVRYEADNVYAWGNESHALLSIWESSYNQELKKAYKLRRRTIDTDNVIPLESEKISRIDGDNPGQKSEPGKWDSYGLDNEKEYGGANAYTVNVMSAGPNRKFNDYDDIWSCPDEFE